MNQDDVIWNDLPKTEKMKRMALEYTQNKRVLMLIDNYNGRYIHPVLIDELPYQDGQQITLSQAKDLLPTITDSRWVESSQTWIELIEAQQDEIQAT